MVRLILVILIMTPFARADEKNEALGLDAVSPADAREPEIFGSISIRHYQNTYYDTEGYYEKQDPSLHVVAKLGTVMYQKHLALFATGGIIKKPRTQKLLARRPQLESDFYPIFGQYGHVVQYTLIKLPFSESEHDPENAVASRQGTIYTVGLAPKLSLKWDINGARLAVKTGLDASTDFYSRSQYVGERPDERTENEGFLLSREPDQEPIEDYAQHVYMRYMAGFAISPAFMPSFDLDLSVFFNNDYDPVYFEDDDGTISHRYELNTSSHYRARISLELSERLSLENDFYHYHQGFFEGRKKGENRRFRNIARLTCKL